MNSIVHFEIPVDDSEKAKKFYTEAFGWGIRTDKMPNGKDYNSVTTAPTDENFTPKNPGAINGAIIQRDSKLKSPVITVSVDSVEEAIKKIEASGGKVITPKATLEGMGDYAYIADPAGNIIGLWHNL